MFEEYIDKNISGILENFNLNQERIFIDEIVSNNSISNFYKSFALAELDWWILCDEEIKSKSQNFDYSSNDVQSSLLDLEAQLRQKAFFAIEDFESFITFAVKSRINFLCRPQFTLTQFCFNASYEVSVKVLIKKLAYFSDYKYFNSSFLNKIEGLGYNTDTLISKEDFENLIEEIDYDNILNLSSKEFVELVNPIYNIFNLIDNETQEQLVPSEALLIFFDDKSINPIVTALQKKYSDPEFKFINRDTLHKFIVQMIEATESGEIEEETESIFDSELNENNESNEETESVFDSFIDSEDNFDSLINNIENEIIDGSNNQNKFESVDDFDSLINNIENGIINSNITPNILDGKDEFVVKEFEVFDLLDAVNELEQNEGKSDDEYSINQDEIIDIDKIAIEEENDSNFNFDFEEIESLLESGKEEIQENENNELLNEFNLLASEIDNTAVDITNEDEIISVLDDKAFEENLSGDKLIDDIESVLDLKLQVPIIEEEMDILNETTILLQNFNNQRDEVNISDIGSLLDDISKINNLENE